ncbi:MAG: LpxD N-terminal domain-containing protein, partial [Thermodesulfovibrionales bacterium]|nr:LpxD N-terminal domain-containing protein [Thermodesulfovibrionales bacterium]
MKLRAIAELLSGELAGDPDVEIKGAAGLSDAKDGDITFLSTAKLINECIESKASAVIVKDTVPEIKKPQLKVSNPQYAFARLLEHFYVKPFMASGISDKAYVSDKAQIGENVSIYPLAFVSDRASIG